MVDLTFVAGKSGIAGSAPGVHEAQSVHDFDDLIWGHQEDLVRFVPHSLI